MFRQKLIEVLEEAQLQARNTIGSMNNGFAEWYADYLIKNGIIKEGKWVKGYRYGVHHYICSECDEAVIANWTTVTDFNYCPNCGAKMDTSDC